MRLFRLTTNYPHYLKRFYRRNPELTTSDYWEHYHHLAHDCFGWADFWTSALKASGYEVWEVVANARPLQAAWAEENEVELSDSNWGYEVAAAQIRAFGPDVLFIDDYATFTSKFVRDVRNDCPQIRLIVGWCGAPFESVSQFEEYDLVLSNFPHFVDLFRKAGIRSEYLCHGFSTIVLDRLSSGLDNDLPFTFTGSLCLGRNAHRRRAELLEDLARRSGLIVFSDIPQPKVKAVPPGQSRVRSLPRRAVRFLRARRADSGQPSRSHGAKVRETDHAGIRARTERAVFGIEMYSVLSRSMVTLNTHIDIAGDVASNMRLFEATGVGACLLTDWKPDLHRLFEVDREVVTYQSAEEALAKSRWLMENPSICESIARAGQSRTLREHTLEKRAEQLSDMIKSLICATRH